LKYEFFPMVSRARGALMVGTEVPSSLGSNGIIELEGYEQTIDSNSAASVF
jgi:hypothetical protein